MKTSDSFTLEMLKKGVQTLKEFDNQKLKEYSKPMTHILTLRHPDSDEDEQFAVRDVSVKSERSVSYFGLCLSWGSFPSSWIKEIKEIKDE